MPVIIRIPGSLKEWFDGRDEAECNGNSIKNLNEEPNSRRLLPVRLLVIDYRLSSP